MKHYEKIETIYKRDIEGTKQLMPGVWRDQTVEFLKDLQWQWTCKVDGTNIVVCWDGHKVHLGGRTDRAQIPAHLVERLSDIFLTNEAEELFEQMFGEREVYLFGEGYGKKIQADGAKYIPDGVDFILFDLLIGDNYQPREFVEACAKAFGIKAVPIVGEGTLEEAVEYIKTNPDSVLGNLKMEGVVCRPKVELRDRCGNRIIVKIKWRDFKEGGS